MKIKDSTFIQVIHLQITYSHVTGLSKILWESVESAWTFPWTKREGLIQGRETSYPKMQWKSWAEFVTSPKDGHPCRYFWSLNKIFNFLNSLNCPHFGLADFTINNNSREGKPQGAREGHMTYTQLEWRVHLSKGKDSFLDEVFFIIIMN